MNKLRQLFHIATLPRVTALILVGIGFVGEVGYEDLPHRLGLIALCAFTAFMILWADHRHLLD